MTPYPGNAEVLDILAHAGGARRKPAFRLHQLSIDGRLVPMREVASAIRPFCILRSFGRNGADDPPVLIVTPWSGQYAAVFSDLIQGLAPDHTVYVTDWIDAALIPLAEGGFDLDSMIDYIIGFIGLLGPAVHVIATSQSGVPVLAAAALTATANDCNRPRSLILMGGLIDTRLNPTPMNRMARGLFGNPGLARWAEHALIRPVPAGMPGAGRLVYPALIQLAGLGSYLLRRLSPQSPTLLHAFQNVLVGDGEPATAHRQLYHDFLTLMDLPAELYLQTVRTLFRDDALPSGRMHWRGTLVDPAAIHDTGLMTVEAGHDDISGRGQTCAAHELCPHIPNGRRLRHVEPDVGHLGMFHGRRWLTSVLPRLRRFIRDNRPA